jgi:hypothetical protein
LRICCSITRYKHLNLSNCWLRPCRSPTVPSIKELARKYFLDSTYPVASHHSFCYTYQKTQKKKKKKNTKKKHKKNTKIERLALTMLCARRVVMVSFTKSLCESPIQDGFVRGVSALLRVWCHGTVPPVFVFSPLNKHTHTLVNVNYRY